jgi:hypothetical protein
MQTDPDPNRLSRGPLLFGEPLLRQLPGTQGRVGAGECRRETVTHRRKDRSSALQDGRPQQLVVASDRLPHGCFVALPELG